MPRRDDLSTILVIGSGPIVIGQAAEFDYSGTQAVKALRADGYRVVLVNSNPATIMTDPDLADATYIEPVTVGALSDIIDAERPDALLPTLGGQAALNVTTQLAAAGILEKYGIELIGAGIDAIAAAEDRSRFREVMEGVGIACPQARAVTSVQQAQGAAAELGYPLMVRPSYILGGHGTGIATSPNDLEQVVATALAASPVGEALVEESVAGWKEFELEVMRDGADNALIVCSIENIDPMGVHTGDSVAVAPIQTLSDREYQEMRDEAITCLRAVGVETGGSNVQFAVDPASGRRLVIEMNPRVSRSSALASKATGFPIAKIAALVAVGYRLDEIPNDITGVTPAAFEPALDYVVVKVPRFDFEKFPAADTRLTTSMRSIGEVMAIGRTFPEALQKGLRSLDVAGTELTRDPGVADPLAACAAPRPDRLQLVAAALRAGHEVDAVAGVSGIDPWFVEQISAVVCHEARLRSGEPGAVRTAKRLGFSGGQIAELSGTTEQAPPRTYKTVDTCAAEFAAATPYFYSTFEDEDEAPAPGDRTVVVLGSGPNRIGQGIEFDYCCVHASLALRDAGYEAVMVNCNPETVSTDYDTSNRLYFEPLTPEDVLAVIDAEQPVAVIAQFGGQTPLQLAPHLAAAGVTIAGTQPEAIDLAEDRDRFARVCADSGIPQPAHGSATSAGEAVAIAERIGYPVMVRPSFVLGGRAMRIIQDETALADYLEDLSPRLSGPVLIDRFLEDAVEVDVDAVFDGEELFVGGVMEHIEEAGIHSGDSACVLPPVGLGDAVLHRIVGHTSSLAKALGVVGLINIQFAVQGEEVFCLEANPRASRTVPFVSKATGVPLAKVATRVMMGESLASLRREGLLTGSGRRDPAVKVPVFPWSKFPEQDSTLGPEMRATGEVMGRAASFGAAYRRALEGAGMAVPEQGTVFISLADRDKPAGTSVAAELTRRGFRLLATGGTAGFLREQGLPVVHVDKVGEGSWDPVTLIDAGLIDLVINTPSGGKAFGDGRAIRRAAVARSIPVLATMRSARAVVLD